MKSTDSITLQVIAERLNTIVGEMTVTLTRTARSPIANETRDFSVAIFDARGRLVAQSLGCPILMGAMKWSVEGILKDFRHDLHDGDMILNNDPYCGGAHMGDMTLAMPIFYKNRLVLFPAARSHQVDAGGGGVKPGGFNPEARNCFE
ncbi:MAG TPA: hydantoinase B/oxoprolinase family protein, partial [bacterium]|nr:hydantoinase B/oxoprolinase family protein [bacterium]